MTDTPVLDDAEIGRRISDVISKKMTQGDAADIVGVTPKTFAKWLSGETSAKMSGLICLASRLDVPVSVFHTRGQVTDSDPSYPAAQSMSAGLPITLRTLGFRLDQVPRVDLTGNVACHALREAIAGFLEIPAFGRIKQGRSQREAELAAALASKGLPSVRWFDFGVTGYCEQKRAQVANLLGWPPHVLWPTKYPEGLASAAIGKSRTSLTDAIASAQSFSLAIDALPVGKDIRTRLHAHLDAHVARLEALR